MLKKVLIVAAGCFALACTSAQAQDLALNRPATASSTEKGLSEFRPANANDGNSFTRWSSEFVDKQWWQVDLGSNQSINRVELNWEVAYARRYRIRTRTAERGSWSTAATGTISSAGLKTHTFATRRARYVRIQGDVRATPWGISLWDIRVCNGSCSGPAPPPPPDGDGDGVPDSSDQCPNEAGPADNYGCPVPPPSGQPAPIAGQGYSKVWGDEFDSLSSTSWGEGIWYDPGSPANSIFVQNGVLNLVSRRSQGYENITVSTEGGTDPKTFRQGYFEARMRWTKGNGAWPAFWLLSYRHAVNPAWPNLNPICSQLGEPVAHCYSAELDVFEGQGSEPNVFYGTIHRNSSNDYGVSNQQNGNNYQPAGVDLTADFHVYGMKWTGSQITWYLDGRQLHSAPVYDSTDQPMFVLFDMYIGGWTRGTDASTPNELKTEVDWVRVWQS
jgi:F5/8 type C domain/Glycosyl hydrolases family 16